MPPQQEEGDAMAIDSPANTYVVAAAPIAVDVPAATAARSATAAEAQAPTAGAKAMHVNQANHQQQLSPAAAAAVAAAAAGEEPPGYYLTECVAYAARTLEQVLGADQNARWVGCGCGWIT